MIVYLVKYRNPGDSYYLFDAHDKIHPTLIWNKIISITMIKIKSDKLFQHRFESELEEYL